MVGKDGHSVFAYYLLKSLSNNNNNMYDASQLFDAIKIPVVKQLITVTKLPTYQSILVTKADNLSLSKNKQFASYIKFVPNEKKQYFQKQY